MLDYGRLALIGLAAVELSVSRWLCELTMDLAWVLEAGPLQGVRKQEDQSWQERKQAVCNHLAYARTAVKLELDKAFQHSLAGGGPVRAGQCLLGLCRRYTYGWRGVVYGYQAPSGHPHQLVLPPMT